jgi:BirA family transcriptional regulator, biotin operon repressor / biotin---[acetyl-CoA-carboxylase] ligase
VQAAPWRRTIAGVDVRYLPSTGSTQDELKALIAGGAPHLTMVTAGEQLQGRGRSGRSWASPPGNLYTSTLLRPQPGWSSPLHAAFVAALAVAETVRGLVRDGVAVRIKWPNDVMVDGAKIAGILLEAGNARTVGDSGLAVDWLVLGVGINVGWKPEAGLYPTARLADLCATAPTVDDVRARYCAALAAELEVWALSGFAAVRTRVLAQMAGVGGEVTVRLGDRDQDRIAGRFRDLDPDGALVLETAGGLRTVTTGDVFLGAKPPVA